MSQHDYNIQNDLGVAVRADINGALNAIATSNSGASEPATTYAFQLWINTSSNTIYQRNETNTDWYFLGYVNPTLSALQPAVSDGYKAFVRTSTGSGMAQETSVSTNIGIYVIPAAKKQTLLAYLGLRDIPDRFFYDSVPVTVQNTVVETTIFTATFSSDVVMNADNSKGMRITMVGDWGNTTGAAAGITISTYYGGYPIAALNVGSLASQANSGTRGLWRYTTRVMPLWSSGADPRPYNYFNNEIVYSVDGAAGSTNATSSVVSSFSANYTMTLGYHDEATFTVKATLSTASDNFSIRRLFCFAERL